MLPQHVGTGKPNPRELGGDSEVDESAETPDCTDLGTGEVCNLASFDAKDSVGLPRDDVDMSRNSVARKYPFESSLPQASDFGARDGTTECIALREACSPSNIDAAT